MLIGFQKVDLQGIDSSLKEDGFKISNAAPTDQTLEKGDKALNFIQISMPKVTILWELEGNKEVQFIWQQHTLASFHHYVPTGFTLFKYDCEKFMKNTVYFTQNEDRSLIMSPATASAQSHFFRTYSGTNLLEIKALQKSIENQQHTKIIAYSTFLANFNNLTFF